MQLASEILGALGAGALVLLAARQLGASSTRAFGAIAAVPVLAAALLAGPALWQGVDSLNAKRHAYANLSEPEAQVKGGADLGISTDFFAWAKSRLGPEDTFHLEIGAVPDEAYSGGVGTRQAAILQWGMFQLAPNLAVEQSPKARDVRPGEGRGADWIVFYEMDPEESPVPLSEVKTYAPGFAIGKVR